VFHQELLPPFFKSIIQFLKSDIGILKNIPPTSKKTRLYSNTSDILLGLQEPKTTHWHHSSIVNYLWLIFQKTMMYQNQNSND